MTGQFRSLGLSFTFLRNPANGVVYLLAGGNGLIRDGRERSQAWPEVIPGGGPTPGLRASCPANPKRVPFGSLSPGSVARLTLIGV